MTMPFNPYAGSASTVDPRILTALQMPGQPAQPQRLSLWDRLQNAVAPVPQGMDGILGEQDITNARNQGLLAAGAQMLQASGPSTQPRTFAQIAGGGLQAGMQGYQGAVDQQIGRVQGKQGFDFNRMKMDAFKKDQERLAQLSAARQGIIQKAGMPDTSNPQATAAWIDKVLPDLIAAGDEDMVGRLSEIRKSLGEGGQANTYQVDAGDHIELRDKRTNAVIEKIPKGAAPRDTGAGVEQRAALQFQRDFQRTNQLADDYRRETQEVAKAANQYRTVTQVAPAARAGQPAAQISLIFAYMKSLDPSSVVRESEYATAQNAAGVPERVRNQYNKLIDGGFLTPDQVNHFVESAKSGAQGWRRQQENFFRVYRQRAQRWKIDPDDVTLDYFDGIDMSEKPPLSGFNFGGQK